MERTIHKWIVPQSRPGSFLYAVLAHGAAYGTVVALLSIGAFTHKEDPAPVGEEIAYETFSEPPVPAKVVRHIAPRPDPETPAVKTREPDVKPRELQDSSGTVAGTQAAAKPRAAPVGAEGAGDAATTPYYRIKPKYPRAALVAGTEGWVLMKVDVNEGGEVENIRVVGGVERGLFQDEARRAVSKWKYRPFVDASGKPIRKVDHEVRVDFKLKDATA